MSAPSDHPRRRGLHVRVGNSIALAMALAIAVAVAPLTGAHGHEAPEPPPAQVVLADR